MTFTVSIYLDLLRGIASLIVAIWHYWKPYISPWFLSTNLWHDAVIFFFVLSWYVIYYVSVNKHADFLDYITSRMWRFYSIIIYVLLVTFCLDYIWSLINPIWYIYDLWDQSYVLIRYIAWLTFSTEFWWLNIRVWTNWPLWSLSYEFRYYMMFGLLFYLRTKFKYLLFGIIIILVWPRIVTFFPIWLLGAYVYTLHQKELKINKFRWVLWFLGSILLLVLFKVRGIWDVGNTFLNWLLPSRIADNRYLYSTWTFSDYIVWFLTALNVFFIKYVDISNRFRSLLSKYWVVLAIRKIASFSFSIYAFHYPIMLFLVNVLPFNFNYFPISLVFFLLVLYLTYLLSLISEKKRYVYKNKIKHIIQLVAKQFKKTI